MPVTKPQPQTITPLGKTGTLPTDPEDAMTPQLPAVASAQIQKADQRRESAPNNDGGAAQALFQQLNSNNDGRH